MDKKFSRLRRARSTRARIRAGGAHRLCVLRTPRHIYAQIIAPDGATVVASSSTLDTEIKAKLSGSAGNKDAASLIGQIVAERAKAAGVTKVAFDRSGFKYHGRVKALADAAREHGLEF